MRNAIKSILKYIFLFCVGGGIYISIELLYRQYTHWTMFILGGLCFIAIGAINNILSWKTSIFVQSIIGSIIITLLEYVTGYIVNIKLGWDVWDYSNLLFNIDGQICLWFSVIWVWIATIAIILDDYIRYWFFGEQKPKYYL